MKTKIGAVVQARMGSSRLSGKVLKQLSGKPMLEWIILRLKKAKALDVIIVATTSEEKDNSIEELCKKLDINCFRGSEHDVLDRYYQATQKYDLTHVLRITADCPFTDPGIVDDVIHAFLNSDIHPDFAANNFIRKYPRGIDVAMMSSQALKHAWTEAKQDYERVHVTPYIRHNPEKFRLLSIEGDKEYGELRWTVDTEEDFQFAEEIYNRLQLPEQFSWKDVLNIIHKEPQLSEINSHIRQKELREL